MGKGEKPKMLYVGDFPVPTGFGIVSKNLIKHFKKDYDIYVVGVNYYGDYDPLCDGLKVYPATSGDGEIYGFEKTYRLLMQLQPEVCFILNDVWIAAEYAQRIEAYKKEMPDAKTKFILYTPIDAENIKEDFVKPVDAVFDAIVTYTEYGEQQLIESGANLNKVFSIPHGVEFNTFKRMDKVKVKKAMKMKEDDFVVLNVSRNQPRKRLDLFFYVFAEFVKRYNLPKNVRVYYHGALRDYGIDIIQWCRYLGIDDRLAISRPDLTPSTGLTDEQMNMVYNCADVFFTTTAAEGWGLPIAEAMSVGVPCILPAHSALNEWPDGNALMVECYPFPSLTDRGLNTIHHIIDVEKAVEALYTLYTNHELRKEIGDKAEKHIRRAKFDWAVIADHFKAVMKSLKD